MVLYKIKCVAVQVLKKCRGVNVDLLNKSYTGRRQTVWRHFAKPQVLWGLSLYTASLRQTGEVRWVVYLCVSGATSWWYNTPHS